MHAKLRPLQPALALALVAGCLAAALVAPAQAQDKRHHIGFGFGYTKHLSDDLEPPEVPFDFTNAANGFLNYRYSLSRTVDLTLDTRGTVHLEEIGGADLTLANSFFGPGVRVSAPSGTVRPYGQANFLVVSETLEIEEDGFSQKWEDTGIGFGVFAGVDIRASNLLSIPVEMSYLYGKPEDDVSGIGVSAGLTFNFGALD